jgi:hypothetical protein
MVSFILWCVIITLLLPGSRKIISKIMRFGSEDIWKRDVSITLSQVLFYVLNIIMIPASLIMEFIVIATIVAFSLSQSGIAQVSMLVAAGPIEETMKLIASLVLFSFISFTFGSRGVKIDLVRVGIISGLFTGACFGFVESVGYLTIGLEGLLVEGFEISSIDEVLWRFAAGISIHSLYTGIASGGLGRRRKSSRSRVTLILLLVAIAFHSLNNGIQGLIFIILDIEGTLGYVLTDISQLVLLISGVLVLRSVWNGKVFGEDTSSYDSQGTSKRIYARPLH